MIAKRDGTQESFSLPKLRAYLVRGLRGQGYEAQLAEPLARAVAAHLRLWKRPAPPTSEYVHQCALAALALTGFDAAAADLAAHHRLRAARRRRTWVGDPDHPQRRAARWCKAALVATLEQTYRLRRPVARFLAGQIEEQVFARGWRVVSRTLLRELVQHEVLAWGLADEPTYGLAGPCRSGGPAPPAQE